MSDSVDGMFDAIKKLAVRIVSEKLVPEPTLVELFVKALPWITGALSAVSVLALPPTTAPLSSSARSASGARRRRGARRPERSGRQRDAARDRVAAQDQAAAGREAAAQARA